MSAYDEARRAADAVRARIGGVPEVAVVLGSGLGDFAGGLTEGISLAYRDLPHWPAPKVPGHEGRLVVGRRGGRVVAALAGRTHAYEGRGLRQVTFAVRAIGLLGVRTLILTSAAGGVNARFAEGALMVIDDHINLMGLNPLAGPNDDRFGPRFPDLTEVYSSRLRTIADQAGTAVKLPLAHGVYAAVLGPSYETPAEIRYLRTIGADAVGMSTVPEAIAARHMGLDVLGIACITNGAAGAASRPIDHAGVTETARRMRAPFSALLEGIIAGLG
ncbi:MAG: purine-nucleoside phosphorylase [Acidobacteria bacterium]|nr:purine-nucleoside phosphorylase [Acidobacteriota bacterium]